MAFCFASTRIFVIAIALRTSTFLSFSDILARLSAEKQKSTAPFVLPARKTFKNHTGSHSSSSAIRGLGSPLARVFNFFVLGLLRDGYSRSSLILRDGYYSRKRILSTLDIIFSILSNNFLRSAFSVHFFTDTAGSSATVA